MRERLVGLPRGRRLAAPLSDGRTSGWLDLVRATPRGVDHVRAHLLVVREEPAEDSGEWVDRRFRDLVGVSHRGALAVGPQTVASCGGFLLGYVPACRDGTKGEGAVQVGHRDLTNAGPADDAALAGAAPEGGADSTGRGAGQPCAAGALQAAVAVARHIGDPVVELLSAGVDVQIDARLGAGSAH
jgi:hypothetical protein